MDSESAPQRSDSRNPTTMSPKRLNFPHKRRVNSEAFDEASQLRVLNETLQKRITELEAELERVKADDSRSRRRLMELKAKHMTQLQELTARLSRTKTVLPESLEAVVSEKMASVTTLHRELLDELATFQAKTERKLKTKEMDLQHNFDAKLALLGRQLEKRRTLLGNQPSVTGLEKESETSLESKLLQFEEFNNKLQSTNESLRRKLKEAQTLAEVYADQHNNILLENAKLKKMMQDRLTPTPAKTPSCDELPPILLPKAKTVTTSPVSEGPQTAKIAALQRELLSLKGQLIQERNRRTELTDILDKCIEDVKSQSASMAAFSGRHKGDLSQREREQIVKSLSENVRILEIIKAQAFNPSLKTIARSSSVVLMRK